jgi:hypothetical protein
MYTALVLDKLVAVQQSFAGSGYPLSWAVVDQTGSQSLTDSVNVTGISDDGTGLTTVTWDTDYADANYPVIGQGKLTGGGTGFHGAMGMTLNAVPGTGSVQVKCYTPYDNAAFDVINFSIIAGGAPSDIDGWIRFMLTPDVGIDDSFNVTSADDTGETGVFDVFWNTDFDNATWAMGSSSSLSDSGGSSNTLLSYRREDNNPQAGTGRWHQGAPYVATNTRRSYIIVVGDGGGAPFTGRWSHAVIDGTGTVTLLGGVNITSVGDDGTGLYTVTFDVDYANATYAVAMLAQSTASVAAAPLEEEPAAGVLKVGITQTVDAVDVDKDWLCIVVVGDAA